MNNLINARENFKRKIIKDSSEPKKEQPEATKVFYVDFKMKKLLGQTVVDNRKAA